MDQPLDYVLLVLVAGLVAVRGRIYRKDLKGTHDPRVFRIRSLGSLFVLVFMVLGFRSALNKRARNQSGAKGRPF